MASIPEVTMLSAPVPRVRRPPPSKEEGITADILKATGHSYREIADIFGVDPRTASKMVAKVAESDKRAIRQILAAEALSLHMAVARKVLLAILERDLNETFTTKEGEHRYHSTIKDLAVAGGISSDKIETLAAQAGMADPEAGQSAGNPIGDWMLTQDQMQDALRGLPAGVRMKVRQEVSVEGSASDDSSPGSPEPSEAVEAPFEVSD